MMDHSAVFGLIDSRSVHLVQQTRPSLLAAARARELCALRYSLVSFKQLKRREIMYACEYIAPSYPQKRVHSTTSNLSLSVYKCKTGEHAHNIARFVLGYICTPLLRSYNAVLQLQQQQVTPFEYFYVATNNRK